MRVDIRVDAANIALVSGFCEISQVGHQVVRQVIRKHARQDVFAKIALERAIGGRIPSPTARTNAIAHGLLFGMVHKSFDCQCRIADTTAWRYAGASALVWF